MSEESTDTELRRLVASARAKDACSDASTARHLRHDATNVARIKDRFLPAVRYVDHEP